MRDRHPAELVVTVWALLLGACGGDGSTSMLDASVQAELDAGASDDAGAAEREPDELDAASEPEPPMQDAALDEDAGAPPDAGSTQDVAPVVPPLPEPRVIGEVPVSEVLTRIEAWDALQPIVHRARCDWSMSVQRCTYFDDGDRGCGEFVATPESSGTFFSDEIPADQYDLALAVDDLDRRLLLLEGGELVGPQGSFDREALRVNDPGVTLVANARYGHSCPALETTPYMRLDRFWEVVLLDGESPFLLLEGEVGGELSATYTIGVQVEETTGFAQTTTTTVSGEAGLDFFAVSAALEEAFTQTYELSVSVTMERSTTLSQTVQGKAGVTRQFMVWQLVDRFTVTDAAGEPLVDPSYDFDPVVLEVRGAKALKATEF
jgi:hypothetical protein